MGLLNWRMWAAGAVLALLAWSHWTVYHLGRDRVQAAWDREHAETAMQSIITTKRVQTDHDAESKRLRAAIAVRDAAVRDLSARLRDLPAADLLPDRPPAECADYAGRVGEFYRALADRSLALAGDAETVRESLKACRAQYESLRKATP